MTVCSGGSFGLSREYHKKLFGPMFYSWWNCPLRMLTRINVISYRQKENYKGFEKWTYSKPNNFTHEESHL